MHGMKERCSIKDFGRKIAGVEVTCGTDGMLDCKY
jgi:hypothetical protein